MSAYRATKHLIKMARKREARKLPTPDGIRTGGAFAFLGWVIEPNEAKKIKGVPSWRFIGWDKGRSGADIREANKWNGVGRPPPAKRALKLMDRMSGITDLHLGRSEAA